MLLCPIISYDGPQFMPDWQVATNSAVHDCSDVLIIKALRRGVRVIELDIWPNSTKEDGHVLHGRCAT